MVAAEDVDSELERDVQEECSKFGKIETVHVQIDPTLPVNDQQTTVKIFVKFSNSSGKEKSTSSISHFKHAWKLSFAHLSLSCVCVCVCVFLLENRGCPGHLRFEWPLVCWPSHTC